MEELNKNKDLEQQIAEMGGAEACYVKEGHGMYGNLEPFFNSVIGTKADGTIVMYLDYTEDKSSDGIHNVIGLKLYQKTIQLLEAESSSLTVPATRRKEYIDNGLDVDAQLNSVLVDEHLQSIMRKTVNKMFEMAELSADEMYKADPEWWNSSLEVKPPVHPTSVKPSFWKNPLKWLLFWFKPKKEYIWTEKDTVQGMQRKLMAKILALGNLIAVKGRRGAGNMCIVNAKLGTALQDCAGFVFENQQVLAHSIPASPYRIGSIAGVSIYVDPNMRWDDHRILVFRKGRSDEPGLHFTYKVDSMKTKVIFEPTMACHSEIEDLHAIFTTGDRPHVNYITATVDVPDNLI